MIEFQLPFKIIDPANAVKLHRMTVADFNAHAKKPDAHLSLPDGTPMLLTASGVDMFERLTDSFIPQNFHEATVLLWCATRPEEYWLQMWEPAPPVEQDDTAPAIPYHRAMERMREVVAWRDVFLPAGARIQIQALAMRLWNYVHETALEVDEAALPDVPDPEKKSPEAAPTGSSPPPPPSAAETSASGPSFSTAPVTAASSPSTEPGSPLRDSQQSPPGPAPAVMP